MELQVFVEAADHSLADTALMEELVLVGCSLAGTEEHPTEGGEE